MSSVPQYTGCFTLLYADPEVKDQQQYLQPLYGLTASDDPPASPNQQRQRGTTTATTTPTNTPSNGSLTFADDAQSSTGGAQRQKHLRTLSGPLPRPIPADGSGPTSGETGDEASATDAAVVAAARPPRKVDHVGLSLYPDLSTGIVGPQPVFGGAALASAGAGAAAAGAPPLPHLFASDGVPLLNSVVDDGALRQLQVARRPYSAPPPRSGHVLLACPPRGSLILFGGLGDIPFNDVWEFDVKSGRWAELPCVSAADEEEEELQIAAQQQQQRQCAPTLNEEDAPVRPVAAGASPAQPQAVHDAQRCDEDDVASSVGEEGDGRVEDEDVEDAEDGEDASGQGGGRAGVDEQQRQQRRRQRRNMPPPAYGQAAAFYTNRHGETCMAILGGISVGDICCTGFFSLNLNRLTWRRVYTTIPFVDMWGATAQTLHAPRRTPINAATESLDEEVIVLFGGMTEDGEVVRPVSHLFHFDHRLTAAEVEANQDVYLRSVDYDQTEQSRVMRHVLAEEDVSGDDGQDVSINVRCEMWRAAHAATLARWRRRALADMVGKYWAEYLHAPEDLHGRRRPTSASYQRHFMYVFGGRDDFYFYNDLWCLNVLTRTWVQVREGVPAHWLRGFLSEPQNPIYGVWINERGAQLRQEAILKTEAKLLHNSTNGTINPMFRARDVHHALFSSSVNSSARARTGACMVADVRRDCLYVYGGFSYTGQQHLTFFDLHAYYISENVWRRVCICRERPWEAAVDAAEEAVRVVQPLDEGRAYARHATPSLPRPRSSGPTATAEDDAEVRAGAMAGAATAALLPPTLMGYAARYLDADGDEGPAASTAAAAAEPSTAATALLAPPLAPRGARASCTTPRARRELFHLPAMVPEARTMASMVEDPVYPGARFFLHGGRSGEEACGDFFELRTYVGRTVDMEYMKMQRAAREEAAAATAAATTAVPNMSSTSSRGTASPAPAPHPPPSATPTSQHLHQQHQQQQPSSPTDTASLSAIDAARLQWDSRRQLQRQLIGAALESGEGFEDVPAALYGRADEALPLPQHSLRDAATRWMRDGLAAVDPKSLMFVELRNGHALVNLRTHIHYRSRLSLLSGGSGGVDGAGPAPAAANPTVSGSGNTTSPAASTITAAPPRMMHMRPASVSPNTASGRGATPPATFVPMESIDGHLRRSARSLELLLYDVLLSKPVSAGGSCGGSGSGGAAGGGVSGAGSGAGVQGGGTLSQQHSLHHRTCSNVSALPPSLAGPPVAGSESATSPCTRGGGGAGAAMAVSPEPHGSFPSYPVAATGGIGAGGSPGTSPGSGTPRSTSPQLHIVSRAQYTTPRTPQTLTAPSGGVGSGSQLADNSFPSPAPVHAGGGVGGGAGSGDGPIVVARTTSPSLTSRSSSFCSGTGVSTAAAPPANNEYAFHVLLRSLFYTEPFYKSSYASEKKR